MVSLYVTSVEEGAGKTTICAGLGRYLLGKVKKVGFFKPIIASAEQPLEAANHDAIFMKQILGLEEPVDSIRLVIADQGELPRRVKEAYVKVSSGKDVVITEGMCERSIIQALDAKVIAVEGYSEKSPGVNFSDRYKELGGDLLGIVLNKVPVSRLGRVRDEITAQLKGTGIGLLGVLPEDRLLFAPSIGELAEWIQGEMLNSAAQSAELVESFMIGAKTVDPGPEYFGRKSNKAVIARSERPDMQLAALETSTGCLVLCGNTPPTQAVLYGAETKKIPVILAKGDIITTVGSIEDALGRSRFRQEKKLPRLSEMMEQHFNFQGVCSGLDVAG